MQNDAIIFIKKTNPLSKQVEDVTIKGIINPPISFYSLERAYDQSFILGGIFEKLATASDTGFLPTGNSGLDAILDNLDAKYVFENILVFWNCFIEKILDGRGNVVELSPILTHTMSAWLLYNVFGYVQRISGWEQFFLPEEIIHCKTTSMISRYYGDSKFSKAIDQIVLLAQIDQYYGSLFDGGLVGSCLLTDEWDSTGKKLSNDNREALENWMNDNAIGAKNAFKTAIVPTTLKKLELDKNIDTKAFLDYRNDLIESIAIALNIPSDLLTSKNSNRSTAEVAYETLNDIIIKPLQKSFVQDLRDQLRAEFGSSVDKIEMKSSDAQNEEKEAKIFSEYKKSGILTANEVREKLGYPRIDGGDVLITDKQTNPADTVAVLKEIEEIQKSFQKSLYE